MKMVAVYTNGHQSLRKRMANRHALDYYNRAAQIGVMDDEHDASARLTNSRTVQDSMVLAWSWRRITFFMIRSGAKQ